MWKLLFQSVRGTAHERTGQPCQDACLARLIRTPSGNVLLLACADGAGSAARSDVGAALACRHAFCVVRADLADGLPLARVERDTAISWHVRIRQEIARRADELGCPVEQMACTLLLAVVGEAAAVFTQVGDGAIVTQDGGSYGTVFWPQTGEYVNSTNFITEPGADGEMAFALWHERVEELALLTDGLQPLALHYASRRTHQPFFTPMFEHLRRARPGEGLAQALRSFLRSAAVNARTDDDKTLILATRVADGRADAV